MTDHIQRIYYSSAACIDEESGASLHSRGICFGLAKFAQVVPLIAYTNMKTLKEIKEREMCTRYTVRTAISKDGIVSVWSRAKYTMMFCFHLLRILLIEDTYEALFYLRWAYFSFPLIALLVISRATYFLEENTMDGPEQRSMGRTFRAKVSGFLESIAVRHAAGVFCITDEIARHICNRYSYPEYKTKVIPTGVEPGITKNEQPRDVLRRKHFGAEKSSDFLIGFIGKAGYHWHGTSEMIELVNGLDDESIYLIIIGQEAKGPSTPRIRYMGHIDEASLLPMLPALDMAFSSMNLKAIMMTQGCPIKVGIYLDAGLPTVINYDDVRFNGDEPFILNLSDVDPVEAFSALRDFIDYVRLGNESLRELARSFVRSRLSWDLMAKRTYEFMVSSSMLGG